METLRKYFCYRLLFHFTLLLVVSVLMISSAGCQHTPLEGETYRKIAVAWPLFDFENTKGVNADGTRWEKEKGDSCFWLKTWEKERRYDKDDFLIYRKERDCFFPIYTDELEEDREFRDHKGAVLIFPFYSRKAKTAENEQGR